MDILGHYKPIITAKMPSNNFIRFKRNVEKDKHLVHPVQNISLMAKKKLSLFCEKKYI